MSLILLFFLFDPFISWQPHHWSTGAYMINRAGMQTLLDKVNRDRLVATQHVDQAPMGWKILQFVTNNPCVAEHSGNLLDPFISWQPHHWSTGGYMINRAGIEILLGKVHSKSS